MRNPFRRRDYERFDGPGFVMEREGRFLRMKSTLDASGHSRMRQMLGESVDDIKQDMSKQVDDLYSILHRYRAECVLGALWFRNAPMGSTAANHEKKEDAVLAHVEYLAILYSRNRGFGNEYIVLPDVLEDIEQRIESLFHATAWLWMAQDAARHGTEEANASRDLWFMTLMNSLVVRYPGHFDHMKQMLLGIEAEMKQNLTHWLGWTIADAVAIGDAIIAQVDDRLNENLARGAREAEKSHDTAWPHGHGVLARAVKRFLPPHRRPWNRKRIYLLTAWVQFLMQEATTFSVDELAGATGIERSRVAALMRAASLPWGSCEEDYFRFPHPTPPILTRPCMELSEDVYLVPVPTSFSWAIRSLVEETLKSIEASGQARCWDAYEQARASFTERETVGLLAKAFPNAGALHSLKYSCVRDGATIQGELDGLLLLDDTAVLVEVKAGTLSPEARRGAPDRMRQQLEALIGKAHEQALKAKEFLQSGQSVVFDLTSHKKLQVQADKFRDFVLITVNLDPLDIFTTNLSRLVKFGVVDDTDLPWAVSYLDLVVIADALEFPAQLLHYLKRRQRINQLGFIEAHDELDWFGHYLKEGLFFEHLTKNAESANGKFTFSIVGYSADLDSYYMHNHRYPYERPPIPRQPMPEPMRQMLRELEEAHHHGYLPLSLALLDLSWEARETFFSTAEELIRRTQADRMNHDMTMVLDDDQGGLTFMSDTEKDRLQARLFAYCRMKKYQCRCSCWIGIGKLVDTKTWVDVAIVIKHPWEYDEKLEELVAAALNPLPKPWRRPEAPSK